MMGGRSQCRNGQAAEREDNEALPVEMHTIQRHTKDIYKPGRSVVPDPDEPDGPYRRVECATAEPNPAGTQHEEEQEFGQGILGFPTDRRPDSFRRTRRAGDNSDINRWLEAYPNLLGDQVDTEERREQACNLLATWRDLFVTDVEDMPMTDIIEHRIPTYSHTIPKSARVGLFTPEEIKFQQLILPKMERAGIITRCKSPWAARTKFPRRKNGKLRMVHAFIPINSATIKSQYPMKRLEPLLREVLRNGMTCFFTADAANGYWAVPLHRPHAYKTAFYAYDGQYCYLRMGQGLTGRPATYSRLKDIVTGRIPGPSPEPALTDVSSDTIFGHFMDDDFGGGKGFDVVERFLHHHYFPRLAWSGLTLTPEKVILFTSRFNILGHARDGHGIRPSEDKLAAFREWPTPTNEEELMRFIYTLPFFRAFIPGRADLTSVMKQSLIQELVQRTVKGKPRTVRHTIDFKWGTAQQRAFETVKTAVLEQSTTAGSKAQQYHLATDASNTGAGGVLFQINGFPVGTPSSVETRPHKQIIMFMSFQFLPAETRYKTTEREALAVLKSLEECRWIVQGSKYPVKLYTDHSALVSLLKEDDSHGRIARWQYRLSEYVLDIKHVPGKELAIADGLSRIRGYPSYLPPTRQDPSVRMAMMADPAPVDPPAEDRKIDVADDPDAENESAAEDEGVAIDPDWELGWEVWTASAWYSDIVEYKITGRLVIQGMLAQSEQRRLQRQARRFVLFDGDSNRLLYRERSGKLSSCLLPHEVEDALQQIHDMHGHFAEDIVMQKAIGRFYWPTRRLDIFKYCRLCVNCQMLGLLKPTQGLLPILQLQPLDMIGIDFIGPFRPIADLGARYICIAVDYFS